MGIELCLVGGYFREDPPASARLGRILGSDRRQSQSNSTDDDAPAGGDIGGSSPMKGSRPVTAKIRVPPSENTSDAGSLLPLPHCSGAPTRGARDVDPSLRSLPRRGSVC